MNRRSLLVGVGTGAAATLAGCTQRVTGWSALQVGLRNALESAVEVRFRIVVGDRLAFDRRFDLAARANRTVEAAVDVPWDASLEFHASRVGGDATTTERWSASVPLWGGNRCMIEPWIEVDDDGVEIRRTCVA